MRAWAEAAAHLARGERSRVKPGSDRRAACPPRAESTDPRRSGVRFRSLAGIQPVRALNGGRVTPDRWGLATRCEIGDRIVRGANRIARVRRPARQGQWILDCAL